MFPTFGLVSLGLMALSIGLSILAGYMMKEKLKSPLVDEKPTQLATRGSFCSWLIGIHKVGPVFCWVGGRTRRWEKAAGGKGGMFGGGSEVAVWYECCMHVLGVGVVNALHQIVSNGETIFQGPINRDTHPSGSLTDLGDVGSFRIYWGEEDQPKDWLITQQGVDSRWPGFCYIRWTNVRLGQTPVWPMMEYVIERRPQEAILTDSNAWLDSAQVLDGESFDVIAASDGAEGVGYFKIDGAAGSFPAGTQFRLTGNSTLPDTTYIVFHSTIVAVPPISYSTYIYPEGGLAGSTGDGALQLYTDADDEGANPAHAIADLLFAEWPKGLGLSQDDWDMDSLEAIGTTLETEDLRTHLLSASSGKGETALALLGTLLQDLGCLAPINTATGKVMFRLVRYQSSPETIPEDMLLDLPDIDTLHYSRPIDRIIFSFLNRDVGFRDMTFVVADDGQASFLEHQIYEKADIRTATGIVTASKIAQRRGQEGLGNPAVIKLGIGRAARSFLPGDVYYVASLPEPLRVSTVQVDTETSRVGVEFLTDFYGVPLSTYTNHPTTIDPGIKTVEPDLASILVEVPEYLLGSDPQTVVLAHIRAHDQISASSLYISQDDATYVRLHTDLDAQTGGTLDANFDAGSFFLIAQGPTITVLGPDIADVQDLSGDLTNWALGRQVAIIGGEIFFLQKVTAMGGDQYRLDGLLRARYDTLQENHLAGAPVIIGTLNESGVFPLRDVLIIPEQDLYGKSQPQAGGVYPLSGINPAYRYLYGKGVRPIPVTSLRVTTPNLVNAYATGKDITAVWSYAVPSVPGLGAGLQGAGTAVGTPDPEGSFQVDILTLGDVLKRSESVSVATYTYTNVNLQADLGSEVGFKIRVTQLRNGYLADSTTITVEKI